MNIECPSCATNNSIEYGENILCHKCNCTFAGHTYKKFKKPLVSVTSAILIGGIGTYHAHQYFFEEQRYPLSVEYELLDNCISSSKILMDSYYQVNKTKICVCALEKTTDEISYKELMSKKSESQFTTRFRANLNSCY
jgi:hypothetical protein